MKDFLSGLIESSKEIASPFISEAMWTQALQDVSPILGRGGVDSTGKRIYDLQVDSVGDAFYKSIAHLAETQFPLNYNQLKRIGLSLIPKDSEGRFDARGNEFELGNELSGIAGMRKVKIDPSKGITYKITDYKDGIRAARGLFASRTLKGGPVSPEEVVDAYLASNEALFNINREMYKDIEAARILGMPENKIEEIMDRRGERRAFNALINQEFRPYEISNEIEKVFEFNAEQLGLPNPFVAANDVIDSLRDTLSQIPISQNTFPKLTNPFRKSILPTFGQTTNNNLIGQLPPVVLGADVVSVANSLNQNLVGGVNPQTTQLIQQSNALDSFIRGR
jgi:hypothetical protein